MIEFFFAGCFCQFFWPDLYLSRCCGANLKVSCSLNQRIRTRLQLTHVIVLNGTSMCVGHIKIFTLTHQHILTSTDFTLSQHVSHADKLCL